LAHILFTLYEFEINYGKFGDIIIFDGISNKIFFSIFPKNTHVFFSFTVPVSKQEQNTLLIDTRDEQGDMSDWS